jgi:transcriptional regulator with XRE-family HTH domain
VYGQRRVPGLRRAEVSTLAGVSIEYYTRLERGNLKGVSDSVLDALARALRLDDTERMYLHDLARAAGPAPESRQRNTRPTVPVRLSQPRVVVYSAPAGSPSEDSLKLLASWSATSHPSAR